MNNSADSGGNLIVKIVSLWAMVGVTSWSEAASLAAFWLTVYLLCRHIYRDIVRPFLESSRVFKSHKAKLNDVTDLEGME